MKKIKRPTIPQRAKVRSLLQQEIISMCPFCDNTDVEYFEIHHIDNNPSNNQVENLILLCPTCYAKITKEDVLKETVKKVKKMLPVKSQIECASISIDSNMCSWEPYDNSSNAFYNNGNRKSPYPIINFSLINNSTKTVLLTMIRLMAKHFEGGLSGFSQPNLLKPIAKFQIKIPLENETTCFHLIDEIEVPPMKAFKLQVQLFWQGTKEILPFDGIAKLNFNFRFNNNIYISTSEIFLNCNDENSVTEILN